MQELLGRVSPELGRSSSRTGALLATSLIVAGWSYFILTGSISTIWPMFGIANQLLACTVLSVGTTIVLREAKLRRYALVTFLPLVFIGVTTFTAGVSSLRLIFIPMLRSPATMTKGLVDSIVTIVLLVCVTFVIAGSSARWRSILRARSTPTAAAAE
jgi:carbon starvation protein